MFDLPKTIFGSNNSSLIFKILAPMHRGSDIYPPVEINILILFFLKKEIDLKIKIIIKRKSNGIISKFFEIGFTLNIFKLYSSLFKNLTPLKSDVIETSKLSSRCLYIMVAGIT